MHERLPSQRAKLAALEERALRIVAELAPHNERLRTQLARDERYIERRRA